MQHINELVELRKRIAELKALKNECKQTEEALRRSEERYRTFFEQSRDAIYITSQEGEILDANQSTSDLFGYSKEEMIGLNVMKTYVRSEDRLKLQQMIERERFVRDYEIKLRKKDGTEMDCLLTSILRRTPDGDILGYQGIIRDITEGKKIEKALRDSEEKYYRVLEYANQGILVGRDGMIKFSNPKMSEISGYSQKELCSMPFLELVHPNDREMVHERHIKRLQGKEIPHIYDFRAIDKDGNIKWVEINAVLFIWEGRPATLAFLSDVSKRKETEKKVCIYQEQLRSLASELSLIEARERRQIATDLHDHIGQNLAIAKIKLGELREMVFPAKLVDYVDKIQEYVEESIHFTRSLTFELSPRFFTS